MTSSAEWFSTSTFNEQRADAADLLRRKDEAGQTIGVCLPTLNEEATIGGICRLLTEQLVERTPLLDEVVVIDSGSSDATMRVAREAGASVHDMTTILADWNRADATGKGEALWKSLAIMKSDIVVWLDADVRNFHPSSVVKLIEPLISRGYMLVKAFYRRPLQETDDAGDHARVDPWGGGRVTELLARPLLNSLCPELAYFVQPLAGECAATRDLLLDLPIATGYGVEIGVLVDTLRTHGLDATAQVNLDTRVHRNRDSRALGRMSFEVLNALLRRLERAGSLKIEHDLPSTLIQFSGTAPGAVPDEWNRPTIDRPPMRGVLSD